MIAWPAWPVPLACALAPAAAVHLALCLSVAAGLVPDCIPYIEGCTSISRAARHGDANLAFRLLVLPTALLMAIHWALARDWLRLTLGDPRAGRGLLAAGLVGAIALAIYTTFLGTEGAIYQWMRRFGITFYFGATFLAFLLFLRLLLRARVHRGIARAMGVVCALALALGLASLAVNAVVADGPQRDRLGNVLEWNVTALMTAWFVLHAALWRKAGFRLRLYP